jgi:hypothetical protein
MAYLPTSETRIPHAHTHTKERKRDDRAWLLSVLLLLLDDDGDDDGESFIFVVFVSGSLCCCCCCCCSRFENESSRIHSLREMFIQCQRDVVVVAREKNDDVDARDTVVEGIFFDGDCCRG